MNERSALTADEIRSVAADLVAAGPVLGTGPPDRVAARLGWPVRDVEPDLGLIVETGYRAANGRGELWVDRDAVVGILVNITRTEIGGGQAAVDFRRDAFAEAAAVLRAVYGEPAQRRAGRLPEVTWRLPDGTRLRLRQGRFSVALTLTRADDEDAENDEDVEVPA